MCKFTVQKLNAGNGDVIDEYTRNGFEDNPEDTKWVAEFFMPTASEYGCKTIFFIIDKANLLKEELDAMLFLCEQPLLGN